MNPEDGFATLNRSIAEIRRYWPRRGERLVRRWLRTWLNDMRGARRSLAIHDEDEVLEGASIFRRSTYLNLLPHV